jgi:energy-coupling factor transporter ATP-binding protein EcfA2
MTLVTAGRSGAGKSTLIRNMLGLKDDAKPGGGGHHLQHQHSPSSVTKEVELYSSLREGGITIHMVDTPSLNASDVTDARAMALLQEKTGGGRCDMLLYCVSLLPDSKIDKEDKEIIRKLTLVFGQDVWRRTVLVLTFANAVKALYPEQSVKDIVEEYAKKFQSALHFVFKSDISVVSIFSCDWSQTQRDADTIIAVPAGYSPDERFIKKLRQGWDEMIFGEVFKKCNPDTVPVLFDTKHPSHPRMVRMPLNVCKLVAGTVLFAAIGGQPLSLV